MQAQDVGPAKWAIGRRTKGATDAQLDRAYAAGTILRTHVLRPTWHFVLPADIRWLLAATAPRVQARNAHRYRQLGLDAETLERSGSLLGGALCGGRQFTRKEAAATLTAAGIAVDGQRLAYILMNAELNGIICSGAPRGSQHTYALLRERAPQARELTRDEALAELTLRYFTSHGPATAKDFASWASLTVADVTLGLQAVGARLQHEVIDGVAFWSAAAPPAPAARIPDGASAAGLRRVRHGLQRDEARAGPAGLAVAAGHAAGVHAGGAARRPFGRLLEEDGREGLSQGAGRASRAVRRCTDEGPRDGGGQVW